MVRTVTLGMLEQVRIASPCPMKWEEMTPADQSGADRIRYCGPCHLNVYNLSNMGRAEAESLILKSEGRLCIGFFRRADGTVLTHDCPVGLRAVRLRTIRMATRVAAALGAMLTGGTLLSARGDSTRLSMLEPFSTIRRVLMPKAVLPPPPAQGLFLGEMQAPPQVGRPSTPTKPAQPS